MKLTIERSTLLKALAHVQSVVERRNTIPILANVLLDASDGTLTLTATDMDLAITEKIAADVSQAGASTAPARTFYDIVRKLPEGAQVEVETAVAEPARENAAQRTDKPNRSGGNVDRSPKPARKRNGKK